MPRRSSQPYQNGWVAVTGHEAFLAVCPFSRYFEHNAKVITTVPEHLLTIVDWTTHAVKIPWLVYVPGAKTSSRAHSQHIDRRQVLLL